MGILQTYPIPVAITLLMVIGSTVYLCCCGEDNDAQRDMRIATQKDDSPGGDAVRDEQDEPTPKRTDDEAKEADEDAGKEEAGSPPTTVTEVDAKQPVESTNDAPAPKEEDSAPAPQKEDSATPQAPVADKKATKKKKKRSKRT